MDQKALYDARLELVDFVIDAFWNTPTDEFVENLLSGDVRVPTADVNPALDEGFSHLSRFVEANRGRSVGAVQADLDVAYSRTFVGPRPPVVAHETYYRDDTDFIGKGLANVQASYAAAGWTPPEEYPEEDDFVAVEFAFLRHLVGRQREGAEETFGYERVFLDEHLGTWVDDFADDVLEETDSDLYRAAACVARGVVEFEDELVAQVVSG